MGQRGTPGLCTLLGKPYTDGIPPEEHVRVLYTCLVFLQTRIEEMCKYKMSAVVEHVWEHDLSNINPLLLWHMTMFITGVLVYLEIQQGNGITSASFCLCFVICYFYR